MSIMYRIQARLFKWEMANNELFGIDIIWENFPFDFQWRSVSLSSTFIVCGTN